jgi:YegS/Rv2252/BmrU family lipid kinase
VPVSEQTVERGGQRHAAVIVNPTKFPDLGAVERSVTQACLDHGWAAPLWLETTADDTGRGQTEQALAEGVDLVCPLGGDGTVRAVAEVLVHTGMPLGLLPGGTGNLLARNLGLPFTDLDASLAIALTGHDRTIDVGRVRFDVSGEDHDAREQVFLVMAGIGFDAAMMAGAPERLKARVGWLAYAVSGARHLVGPRVKVRIKADDEPSYTRSVHTVLVGNCGQLTGGLELMPDAEVDDGWLDAVALSPHGVVGWAAMTVQLLSKRRHPRVERMRCRELRVAAQRPQEGELDGDTVGQVRAMRVRVDPGALLVRMPGGGGA